MAKRSLILVESPSKARTIERYLGKDYHVLACNGHIKDLPKKELGVDIENNFKAKYTVLPDKKKILKKIKDEAKTAPMIYIATDPDREGEAIAWHISTELNGNSDKIKRVLFTEITPKGIEKGMADQRGLNTNLVDAQQARRIIDRIVGFKVSELLWKILYNGLSAGRVQSVALRLVCERHEEIINFKPKEYWSLEIELKTEGDENFTSKLHKISGKKPEISNEESMNEIINSIKENDFKVDSIKQKDVKKYPYPPYITSTLQQDAANRLGFTPSRTMRLAQKLYEGVNIGGSERTGLITYMRTDSTRISDSAINEVRQIILSQFGDNFLPGTPNHYKQKKKLVQDAHEAIRPSQPETLPDEMEGILEKDELKLYRLIWQRFTASQMKPAILSQTTIDIGARTDYIFRTTGSVVKFNGFRKAFPHIKEQEETFIPSSLNEGDSLKLMGFKPQQHFTQPPPYYNESSLIKELDDLGIGRPSTFAETVSRILKREYVSKEEKKLMPTEVGLTVNKVLTNNLPSIFNVQFTAKMEEELDSIEAGKQNYLDTLNHFYKPFSESLEKVQKNSAEIKASLVKETSEICEKCGSKMVVKWNRRGQKFLACSGFPDCRNTLSLEKQEEPQLLEKNCPKCKNNLVVKTGRFGRYIGCSNYPECKHTESFTLGIACPKSGCEGEIVERTTRKKKIFYGCNKYPDCDYASWRKPVLFNCTKCSHYIVEEVVKNGQLSYACPECRETYTSIESVVEQ